MFARGAFRPKFVARDQMLNFFQRIGRINTSLITKIQISGQMRTFRGTGEWDITVPGFHRILNIHSRII